MIKFLISRIKRRSLERQQSIVNETWDEGRKLEQARLQCAKAERLYRDAVARRDTRDKNRYLAAFVEAKTAVLRAEIAR